MAQFDSGGVAIAFDDIGPRNAKRTILLLHGFASNRTEMWRRLGWYGAFERKGYRLLAPDWRGHGQSAKPLEPEAYSTDVLVSDVLGLLDHAGASKVDVLGYSLGARLALAVAIAGQNRIDHLVLGGVGARVFEASLGADVMAQAMMTDDPATISDPLLRSFRHFADEQGEERYALAAMTRAPHRRIDVAEFSKLRLPVLVVAGVRDTLAGDPQVLADAFPDGRAVSLPGCDHFSAIPHALFKAAVFDFLDGMPD